MGGADADASFESQTATRGFSTEQIIELARAGKTVLLVSRAGKQGDGFAGRGEISLKGVRSVSRGRRARRT